MAALGLLSRSPHRRQHHHHAPLTKPGRGPFAVALSILMHDGIDMTEQKPREITVTFKGSCQGNPGPGSWEARMWEPATRKQDDIDGIVRHTTNNRMELRAALEGVLYAREGANLTMIGSKYVVQGMTEWVAKWQANGWRNASKKRVENRELWEALIEAVKKHRQVAWKIG